MLYATEHPGWGGRVRQARRKLWLEAPGIAQRRSCRWSGRAATMRKRGRHGRTGSRRNRRVGEVTALHGRCVGGARAQHSGRSVRHLCIYTMAQTRNNVGAHPRHVRKGTRTKKSQAVSLIQHVLMTLVLRLIMNDGFSFDFSIACSELVLPGFMGKSLLIIIRDTSKRGHAPKSLRQFLLFNMY